MMKGLLTGTGAGRASLTLARKLSAIGLSVAVNVALVIGLAGGREAERPPEPTPSLRFSVVDPPEPPPPPVEDAADMAPSPVVLASLPPLELPPLAAATGGLPVPPTDRALFAFDPGLREVPAYAAALGGGDRSAGEVKPPELLFPPDLSKYYPRHAKVTGVAGATSVRLRIGSGGEVRSVEILESEPPGVFERAAHRASQDLRYRPATKNGRPHPATVKLEFVWRVDA